jgi:hypothetical protein
MDLVATHIANCQRDERSVRNTTNTSELRV